MPEDPKESKAGEKPVSDSAGNPEEKAAEGSEAEKKARADAEAAARVSEEVEAAVKAAKEAEAAAREADAAEAHAKDAIAKAEAAKTAAEAAAEAAADAEYKAIADEVKAESAKGSDYTFKRQGEEIFRREMHEPEFFMHKKDRFPVPILSQEQQDELTRKAEIPVDNTPKYEPEHVLSPEYGGMSSYESGVGSFLEDARTRLEKLKNDPDATARELADAKHNVSYLESLHENYFLGMNVFRTAKDGRSKLKA